MRRYQARRSKQGRQATLPAENRTQHISEQINPAMLATSPPTQEDIWYGRLGSEEDTFWRRLSDTAYQKDLIPSTYLELHNLIFESYRANPLAAAIIEITTSFVLGRGITISANNKRVQAVLMKFWHDPSNHMESRIYNICTELALYGELFIRFYVNKYDGSVKIRLIDPSLIDLIETDPEDIETPLRYHRRPIGQTNFVTDPPPDLPDLRGVSPSSADSHSSVTYTQGEWFTHGTEMLQFCINKVSNAKRGTSDLAVLLPWLRRYKDWLTDRVRINKYKGAFLWEVILQGADKKTIDRKKMEYSYPPEPGNVIIHNEAEKWVAVQPQISANDAAADGRAIKLMIAAGVLIPEHFLSDGNTATRATASEMSLPTLLKFQRRQLVMRDILRAILDRVILEAQRANKLGPRVDTSYDITFPEIDVDDNQVVGTGLNYLINALSVAKNQGWISDETAMKLLFRMTGEEVDLHDEMRKIAAQQQKGSALSASSTMSQASQEPIVPSRRETPSVQPPVDRPTITL